MSAIWELRLYEMLPRRIPDMLHQLTVEIPPLFAKAGVPAPLAVWECFAGQYTATLVYLLRWDSLDQRMAAWSNFYADPQWWKQFEDAHGGEQMLERSHVLVMRASADWRSDFALHAKSWHELHIVDLDATREAASRRALHNDLRAAEEGGAGVSGVFDLAFGPSLPRSVVLLSSTKEGESALPLGGLASARSTSLLRRIG